MVQVLIFEDNADQLHLLQSNIAGEGRKILVARDLEQAKGLLNLRPDLVVADIRYERGGQLDKAAGLKLLDLAKANDETVQVILVTNYASLESSRTAMERGAFDILDRNPTGLDFWAILRAKVRLALHYRELIIRDKAIQ